MVLLHNICQNSSESGCDDTRLRSSVCVATSSFHVTDKAFSITGPCAWNELLSDIKLIKQETQDTPF